MAGSTATAAAPGVQEEADEIVLLDPADFPYGYIPVRGESGASVVLARLPAKAVAFLPGALAPATEPSFWVTLETQEISPEDILEEHHRCRVIFAAIALVWRRSWRPLLKSLG